MFKIQYVSNIGILQFPGHQLKELIHLIHLPLKGVDQHCHRSNRHQILATSALVWLKPGIHGGQSGAKWHQVFDDHKTQPHEKMNHVFDDQNIKLAEITSL